MELARPLVEGVDGLEEEFTVRRESIAGGTVSIAAGGSTLQFILPSFVESFVQAYPQIELEFSINDQFVEGKNPGMSDGSDMLVSGNHRDGEVV